MITAPSGRPVALRLALVCALFFIAQHCVGWAAPDTVAHPAESVLFIGHLNFDCYSDTVTGWGDERRRFLPRAIHWGQPRVALRYNPQTDRYDTLIADSACGMPSDRRLRTTALHYPAWEGVGGSIAFQRMNADTLTDLLFYLWGTVGDSDERRDTLRPLLIFGQQGLDTLPVLDLAAIESFQVAPFFAMELRLGTELIEPAMRDISGRISYVLAPVFIDIEDRDRDTTATPGSGPSDSSGVPPVRLVVYPNPTGVSTQVQVDSIPPGEYRIEVVGVNGLVYLRRDVEVSMTGVLFQTLDLHALPVGYYIVRLYSGTTLYGVYPIIITR